MTHDPSRRIHFGGLPPDVTRRDIVDFVKTRTRANPMYIEIGTYKDGSGCFAHATVEGLRSVLEALNGVPMKGRAIRIGQAKPHWSVPLQKVKKERELAEIAASDLKAAADIERREREQRLAAEFKAYVAAAMADDAADDDSDPMAGVVVHRADPAAVPTRTTFSSVEKFAAIASEVATAQRQKHREKAQYESGAVDNMGGAYNAQPAAVQLHSSGGGANFNKRGDFGLRGPAANNKRDRDVIPLPAPKFSDRAAPAQPPAEPAAPPPPPEPSKEAKKLANLQAKLAALKQKLGKA